MGSVYPMIWFFWGHVTPFCAISCGQGKPETNVLTWLTPAARLGTMSWPYPRPKLNFFPLFSGAKPPSVFASWPSLGGGDVHQKHTSDQWGDYDLRVSSVLALHSALSVLAGSAHFLALPCPPCSLPQAHGSFHPLTDFCPCTYGRTLLGWRRNSVVVGRFLLFVFCFFQDLQSKASVACVSDIFSCLV